MRITSNTPDGAAGWGNWLLLTDDPLAAIRSTMAVVLVGEVADEGTGFEDAGGGQLGVLPREIDGPDAVAHVPEVARFQ